MYTDFHAHNALKSFVKGYSSIYEAPPHRFRKKGKRANFKTYHQADPMKLLKGKVGLNHVTLLPIEEAFTDRWLVRQLASLGLTVGLRTRWSKRLRRQFPTYKKMLDGELEQLKTINKHPSKKRSSQFLIVRNKADFAKNAPVKLVVNVEGLHAFRDTKSYDDPRRFSSTVKSIKQYKSRSNSPATIFSIGITHFEYNHLVGNAYALPIPNALRLTAPGKLARLRPAAGKDLLSNEAKKLIDLCMDDSQEAGRRILIDLKHASPIVRKEFYAYMKDKHKGIPFICTHTGVSGFKTLHQAQRASDLNNAWKKAPLRKFNPWPINLCDEDIEEIYHSSGMIGIVLDQRVLGDMRFLNPKRPHYVKDIEKRLRSLNLRVDKYLHTVMFMDNLLHAVQVINKVPKKHPKQKHDAWKHICLGTDFDGVIDPVNECPTTEEFKILQRDCTFLAKRYYGYQQGGIMDQALMGLSLQTAFKQFFETNLWNFTVRNFPV